MRTFTDSLRLGLLCLFLLWLFVGCGSNAPPRLTKDSGPPQPGMVWDEGAQSWMYPENGSYDGYGSGYPSTEGSGDEVEEYGYGSEDSPSSDEVATADTTSGYEDGYGDSTANPSTDSDPSNDDYANAYANGGGGAGGNQSPGYGEYGDNASGNSNAGYGDGSGGNAGYQSPGYGDEYASANASTGDGYADGYTDSYAAADNGYGATDAAAGSIYAEQVQPILQARCYSCHGGGPRASKGDLQLHTSNAITSSGVINARNPDDSELLIRVKLPEGDENRMPPKGPGLTSEEIATIESWIRGGAQFGGGGDQDPYGDSYASGYGATGTSDAYSNDGYGDDAQPNAPPPPPKNLAEAASRAFQIGNDREAMNLLYAQTLVSSDAATEVLGRYHWVPGLQRAKLGVRWGVAIKYSAKGGYTGSPRPAGVHQDLPGEDNDRDTSDDEVALTDFQNGTLDYYTGDIGDELILRLQNRVEHGYFGEMLKDELTKALSSPDRDEFEDEDFGNDSYASGSAGYGGGYGYGGGGFRAGGGDGSSEQPDSDRIEQIMPGVTMLGEGSQSVLLQRATDENVDLLIVFDVVADPNRKVRIVNTATRARLYDVVANKQLAVTGTIRNVELQRIRAENPDDETIIQEMDKIFDVVDSGYRVREFPDVTNDAAKARVIEFVRALIAQPSDNPLWKLAEVRFYHARGLLKDTHAAAAYKQIAPEYADQLASIKDEEQVRTLFASWLATGTDAGAEDDDGTPNRRRREFR